MDKIFGLAVLTACLGICWFGWPKLQRLIEMYQRGQTELPTNEVYWVLGLGLAALVTLVFGIRYTFGKRRPY